MYLNDFAKFVGFLPSVDSYYYYFNRNISIAFYSMLKILKNTIGQWLEKFRSFPKL